MTDKLKEIETEAKSAYFHSALWEYCPPEVHRLLAALRKAVEQRNSWVIAHSDESGNAIERDDAELLALLADGSQKGEGE